MYGFVNGTTGKSITKDSSHTITVQFPITFTTKSIISFIGNVGGCCFDVGGSNTLSEILLGAYNASTAAKTWRTYHVIVVGS